MRKRGKMDKPDRFHRVGLNWRVGFTLVEILMVVAIIAAISAVVIPQLTTRADLHAQAGARMVIADLAYAQTLAMTTGQRVFIRFDEDDQRYQLLSAWPNTALEHPTTKAPFTVVFGQQDTGLANMTLDEVDFDGAIGLAFDETGAPFSVDVAGSLTPLEEGEIRLEVDWAGVVVTVDGDTGRLSARNDNNP